MSTMTLPELAKKMADIDFLMLSTRAEDGQLAARPMSNNEDVDYDGTSWYFTWSDARMVDDIRRDPAVGLSYQGKAHLFGAPPLFIAVEGQAELITDQQAFEAHWDDSMNRWFKQGPATPGIILIKVQARRINYWDGEEEGEITL
ncbi:pyridoxamine 5'-phosphate oxidase family protein [Janthinobacterium sp. RB2R34]|uniref:pyridoxamine 5'-phosphate oxidase family protein n=1 Tax=Janthinobacterium sp. RB2R34 TaxID=3424193 RepID=UPI003F1F7E1C